MTMRALMRQTSELDALDAHIAAATVPTVPTEDEGVATASVTPAKGVGALTVKTAVSYTHLTLPTTPYV